MADLKLMLYQPDMIPEFIFGELKQKLAELDVRMNVYFCVAALASSRGIDEKKIIGVEFGSTPSERGLKKLSEVAAMMARDVKGLQFVDYHDKNFHSHFRKVGPVFSI